jgi:hypothetical protein
MPVGGFAFSELRRQHRRVMALRVPWQQRRQVVVLVIGNPCQYISKPAGRKTLEL